MEELAVKFAELEAVLMLLIGCESRSQLRDIMAYRSTNSETHSLVLREIPQGLPHFDALS